MQNTAQRIEDSAPLRDEHARLAGKLAARRSIDHLRRALYGLFAAVLSGSAFFRLRWGVVRRGETTAAAIVWSVGALAALLLAATFVSFVLSARLMRAEDRDFARLRELRGKLGLDR